MVNMKKIPLQIFGVVDQDSDHKVKGFLSVNAMDFESDTAAPEAFDLKSFLVRGTLLYNHQLWQDGQGNPIPVGEVQQAHVVKLVDINNDLEWGIKDIATGLQVSTFRKDLVSNLVAGDRGVFIVASVVVEEVWSRVLRRMLRGFSWEGMASLVKVKVGDTYRKLMSNISMYEASLVFTPQQPDSVLVPMMKAAVTDKVAPKQITVEDIQSEMVILCLVFSPTMFDTLDAALWLKKRGFFFEDRIISEDGELVYPQISDELIDIDSARSMQVEKGVQAIVGRPIGKLKENEKCELLALTEKLLGCSVSSIESEVVQEGVDLDMSKQSRVADLKTVLRKGAVTAKTEEVVPVVETPVVEVPAVVPVVPVVETPVVVAPVVAPVEAAITPVSVPVKEEVTPVTPVSVSVSETAPVSTTPVAPVNVADPVMTRRPENEALEASLTNSAVIEKIGSVLSQNLMSVVKQEFDSVLKGMQGTMEAFQKSTSDLVNILRAQSEAVMGVQMAKSAVQSVAPEAAPEVIALSKQVADLQQTVVAMSKTAVSSAVKEEAVVPAKKPLSRGDLILGPNFLGMK